MKENRTFIVFLLAGTLCVGVLDGLAAVLQAVLSDRDPVKSFQFIASGIFGTSAFSGGNAMLALGILFHFCIAFIWTLIFFVLYRALKLYSFNWLITGMLYGIVVWTGMNFIVLPLSNTPPLPFTAASAIKSILILITAVGMPLSFLAKRYYS